MRVYEYAKEKNLTSKDVLNLLKTSGFDIHTHMAVLPQEARVVLDKILSSKAEAPKSSSKPVKPVLSEAKAESNISIKPKTEVKEKEFEKKPVQSQPSIKNEKIEIVNQPMHLRSTENKNFGKKLEFKKELDRPSIATETLKEPVAINEIVVDKEMTLFEVADALKKSSGELIAMLLRKGKIYNRNQILDPSTIADIALSLGIKVVYPEKKISTNTILKSSSEGIERWPVVVVMGHVDHGKTSLLDYIRKTSVAAHEKGGITQHVGAYEVNTPHGKVTFLDTPGHAAFSQMRRRGAKVTDIAVLVVAADDGIMPQTLEAIESAREANLPIIVAINKVDKLTSTAPIETVKRQLAQHNLLTEDWGGTTICVPISAKTGQGVDNLLEMIVLQSQLMDLKAKVDVSAKAYVIESKVEKGYGSVATVIPYEGMLSVGDYFKCGSVTGKVRLLVDTSGKKISKAGPSNPAVVIGFDKIATSGDLLEVISYEKYLHYRSEKEDMASSITSAQQDNANSINLILKSDTFGTSEALINAIKVLSKKAKSNKTLKVVFNGIGDITERDVDFAINTDAMIIGLHTKVEKNAAALAKEQNIEIKTHQIIYRLLEELEEVLAKYKEKIITWKKTGEATVRKVFDIKGIGVVAGSYVSDGIFTRNSKVVCFRRGKQIGEGRISSLERNKKSVKEVQSGLEFGFITTGFSEWQVDDVAHCFVETVEQG